MSETACPMNRDKMKEVREWGTFILSFLTVVAIPLGYAVLHGERLEIEKEIADSYLSKTAYNEDKNRYEQERRDMQQSIGAIQGKLDSVLMEQVHLNDSIAIIKERNSK